MTLSQPETPATTTAEPFISATDLFEGSSRGERMIVLDSDWEWGEHAAWNLYVTRHIPGSFFCDPGTMLSGSPSATAGRNPLPSRAVLQHFVDDWGIQPGVPVRIYDRGGLIYAARAWWILRWAGVTDVRVLDGGTPAWLAAGGDIAAGIGCLRGRGTFEVLAGGAPSMPTTSLDEVKEISAAASTGAAAPLLIDTRPADRFEGRRERLDRRAGDVAGAIGVPVAELLDDGRVPSPEVVRGRLAEHGITGDDVAAETVVYSGSGVSSALFIALMEHAGLPVARHYVGGWSQWSSDRSRPVALG
ncbi:MAG: sulfurtransferase [Corynebacterium sp.]|nr:sulfurtransferase [Corynebacterium sp.]